MLDKETNPGEDAAGDAKRKQNIWQKLKELNPDRVIQSLLVALTLGLVVVGFLQWGTFRSTEDVLAKTDDTNRVGLRPYISATGINVDTERYPLFWDITLILENSGGTPPLELKYVVRSSAEFSVDPEEIFQHPSEADAFFERNIAPKGRIQVDAGMPLSTFFDNRKSWYVSGAIHYRDQFQGTRERISKFCFRIIATKDFKTNTMRPGYDPCPHWNCIDEKACANDRARYEIAARNGIFGQVKKSTEAPNIPIGTGLPSLYGPIIKAK